MAAHWVGWENIFHCETNPFGRKVLNYYWPKSLIYNDITKTDFSIHAGSIDVITGGFPCQPYSIAGKRKGTKDNRHLWPAMLDAIKVIQPRWVVGENVPGLLNWRNGVVLHQIKTDLETEGFEVFPPLLLPACGKEAPHERGRLWIVAYAKSNGLHGSGRLSESGYKTGQSKTEPQKREWIRNDVGGNVQEEIVANTKCKGLEGQNRMEKTIGFERHLARNDWSIWPTESPFFSGNDGIPQRLDAITIPKWRREACAAAGNAVVPQIPFEIFTVIQSFEDSMIR